MLGSARGALLPPHLAMPAPIAAYGFSEGSGATTADSSGNNHTLTINAATWTASGHTGSALTNSSTAQGAGATFSAPSAAITIMGWVQPLDLTAGTTRFAFGFIDNAGNTDVAIFAQRGDFGTSNVLQGDIRLGGGGGPLSTFAGSALTINVWAHLALTYDGATVTLYKNGVAANSGAASGTVAPGDSFYVAGWNTVTPYDTKVIVDDVRVYNVALTPAQIVRAMNTPV